MNILLTGATGFIGGRLLRALRERGHHVRCAGRRAPLGGGDWVAVDFAAAPAPAQWREALQGIDAVVNAVGIFRPQHGQGFEALHHQAPAALFRACADHGVARVLQVSALGVEAGLVPYQRSKHQADECLLALPLDGVVAQPSLVFGTTGASARWFLMLASLPLLPLPARGRQPLQPVHVDDVVQALCALLEAPAGRWSRQRVPLVGPAPLDWRGYLQGLRGALGLPPARGLPVPAALVAAAARLGGWLRHPLLDRDSWRMLQQGATASPAAIAQLLGRPPRGVQAFVAADESPAWRSRAQLDALLPLLRGSLALVWIVTGLLSLGLFPRDESYALLARAGVPAMLQPAALFGAAALDLALGVLTLRPPRRWRRWLWAAQAGLMGVYTAIITWKLPEFWLHPYGPLLKNLPMLAILALLWVLDGEASKEQR
jgi:uncharacterized protein YbjT (DUF2867 family)